MTPKALPENRTYLWYFIDGVFTVWHFDISDVPSCKKKFVRRHFHRKIIFSKWLTHLPFISNLPEIYWEIIVSAIFVQESGGVCELKWVLLLTSNRIILPKIYNAAISPKSSQSKPNYFCVKDNHHHHLNPRIANDLWHNYTLEWNYPNRNCPKLLKGDDAGIGLIALIGNRFVKLTAFTSKTDE